MKRTATAFVLLAGLGGGCMTTEKKSDPAKTAPTMSMKQGMSPQYMGPHGEPVTPVAARGAAPTGRYASQGGIVTVSGEDHGFGDDVSHKAGGGHVPVGSDGVPGYYPGRGIMPVPAMGPYGAVAAVGALPAMGMGAPINARTSVRFSDPNDMRITWYGPGGLSDTVLTTPARYNFAQGGIYRLKISNIGRGGIDLYPTLEVVPATAKTATYLAHSSVPVSFTDEDFEQVLAGNYLEKVIYLPDPQYQDLAAVAGPAKVISTKLEPGVDPKAEARRRGEILLIVRMGNIDLDAKGTPAMDAPNPFAGGMPGPMMPMGPAPKTAVKPMPTKLP